MTVRDGFESHLWLRTQLRRAASSSCTNIAEGFLRSAPREFARYLRISRGSLGEILVHTDDVAAFGLASEEECLKITRLAKRGVRAATRLIQYLESLPRNRGEASAAWNGQNAVNAAVRNNGRESQKREDLAEPNEPQEPYEPQEPQEP